MECKDPLISVYIGYYIVTHVFFSGKHLERGLMETKLDMLYCTAKTGNCMAES